MKPNEFCDFMNLKTINIVWKHVFDSTMECNAWWLMQDNWWKEGDTSWIPFLALCNLKAIAFVSQMKVEGMVPYQLLSNQLHDLTQDELVTNMNFFTRYLMKSKWYHVLGEIGLEEIWISKLVDGSYDFKFLVQLFKLIENFTNHMTQMSMSWGSFI
jgi:hypothetical protein